MCRPGLGREGWDKWDRRHHLNNLGTGRAGDHSPTTSCFQLDIPLWKFCYMHEYSGVLWVPVPPRLHRRPHREMYGREWMRAGHHVRRECQVPQHTRLLQVFLSTRIWGRWERVVQQLVTLIDCVLLPQLFRLLRLTDSFHQWTSDSSFFQYLLWLIGQLFSSQMMKIIEGTSHLLYKRQSLFFTVFTICLYITL